MEHFTRTRLETNTYQRPKILGWISSSFYHCVVDILKELKTVLLKQTKVFLWPNLFPSSEKVLNWNSDGMGRGKSIMKYSPSSQTNKFIFMSNVQVIEVREDELHLNTKGWCIQLDMFVSIDLFAKVWNQGECLFIYPKCW